MNESQGPANLVDDRRFAVVVALVLVLTALPRFWAAWADQGLFWPDEIFQSLEQAHRAVFGYGTVPWEFRRGARSWVFPGLLAGLLQVGAWIGLDSGRSIVLLAKTAMALVSLTGSYLSMQLARRLAGTTAALIAGLFTGFFAASILLGSRCSAETVSGTTLMGTVLLATRPGRRTQLIAGALGGLTIFLRYQTGLVMVGLLAILVFERRRSDALYFALGLGVVGVLGGLLDWATWGRPFQAFRMYLWFNLSKSAAKYGSYPFSYYLKVAWNISGPALLVILAGLAWSARLAPKLLLLVVGYVLAHSIVPHKEFRFLMPVAPLAFALAGAGLADAFRRVRHGTIMAITISAACAAWMTFESTQLTWERLGFPSDRGARSPWHSGEGINRLLWALGGRKDVCGVIVTGESIGWIGGFSYLHLDVNMYPEAGETERASANYLIAPSSVAAPAGYAKVDASREFALLRREGSCQESQDHRHELPY